MFKITSVAAALVVAFLLSGCGAVTDEPEPAAQVAAIKPVRLHADNTQQAIPATGRDAAYLRVLRTRLNGMAATPDADLIAAGHYACELYAQGKAAKDIDIIDGDSAGEPRPGWNDSVIAYWAPIAYCPEHTQH